MTRDGGRRGTENDEAESEADVDELRDRDGDGLLIPEPEMPPSWRLDASSAA